MSQYGRLLNKIIIDISGFGSVFSFLIFTFITAINIYLSFIKNTKIFKLINITIIV